MLYRPFGDLSLSRFIADLRERGMTKAVCGDLEKHAYSLNDSISDSNIRNLHILTAVS